jgi:archaellum component FlaD/FlaE
VFEWLEELLTAVGRDGTLSALEYYESIGWLSGRSREELEDVASGLSDPGPEAAAPSLGIDDHRESLLYIARLAGRRSG